MLGHSLQKAILRREIMSVLQKTPPEVFVEAGLIIKNSVAAWLSQPSSKPCLKLACFTSFKDEIDTKPLNEFLFATGLSRCFPLVAPSKTLEFIDDDKSPVELGQMDVVFVPGLAFGLDGTRLGRGLGCYDRFLARLVTLSKKPLLVALALDCQVKKSIPVEAHDIPMDYLCTPSLGMHKTKNEENHD